MWPLISVFQILPLKRLCWADAFFSTGMISHASPNKLSVTVTVTRTQVSEKAPPSPPGLTVTVTSVLELQLQQGRPNSPGTKGEGRGLFCNLRLIFKQIIRDRDRDYMQWKPVWAQLPAATSIFYTKEQAGVVWLGTCSSEWLMISDSRESTLFHLLQNSCSKCMCHGCVCMCICIHTHTHRLFVLSKGSHTGCTDYSQPPTCCMLENILIHTCVISALIDLKNYFKKYSPT